MYLESLMIKNYRKFGGKDNVIAFVKPKAIEIQTEPQGVQSVIAPSTTLIIGKNNAGKTTVVNALKLICQSRQPTASDFNLSYLNALLKEYRNAFEENNNTIFDELDTPKLEFILQISVEFDEKNRMTNLSPFISISEEESEKPVSVYIKIIVSLVEESSFKTRVSEILKETDNQGVRLDDKKQFERFYAILAKELRDEGTNGKFYKIAFFDVKGEETESFLLNKLINLKEIKANRHLSDEVLSNVFNKIVAFQFSNDKPSRQKLESSIKAMNENISCDVGGKSYDISQVLAEIENTNKVDLNLSGNVSYDAIMKGLIKYNFMDGGDYIPEDQFGLGYINLLNIIGEIIHFVDSYENESEYHSINLLFIEEPEAFMHPQMQEFFIKRIDNAVRKALEIANTSSGAVKALQCQIAITTHSSHIVNSKIHSSNTFNNLNYLTSINKFTKAIILTDASVIEDDSGVEEKEEGNAKKTGQKKSTKKGVKKSSKDEIDKTLIFIKKHIKYKVSELFFSDAVIFVEGITEETLLNHLIEEHVELCNYHISVFNINGAHGKLYLPLVKKLSIPCLIVTDLDIKRAKCEKNENHDTKDDCMACGQIAKKENVKFQKGCTPSYVQITSLAGRSTTNATLKALNMRFKGKAELDSDKIDNIDFFEDNNCFVVFQKDPIQGQYATSFEEALILTNFNNVIINDVLLECAKQTYKEIVGKNVVNYDELIKKSFQLQKKLSNSKSDFSNKILFKYFTGEERFSLPNYLNTGLVWLAKKLKSNNTLSSGEVLLAEETTKTLLVGGNKESQHDAQ